MPPIRDPAPVIARPHLDPAVRSFETPSWMATELGPAINHSRDVEDR
jgi:hypothetical protein